MQWIQKLRRPTLSFIYLLCTLELGACQAEPDSTHMTLSPVAIADDDECHLCGMVINRFQGPKGEAYLNGSEQVLKFCSTRELFTFLLQPEYSRQLQAVYVHDMATSQWHQPTATAEAFIDARRAFYVINHSLRGSMGATLASFRHQSDADKFAAEYGGQVLTFEQINLDTLSTIRTAAEN